MPGHPAFVPLNLRYSPAQISMLDIRASCKLLPPGLTASEKGRKWRHGTSIQHFLCERFDRSFSILQKIGGTRDGAVPGLGIVHESGRGIELYRDHSE